MYKGSEGTVLPTSIIGSWKPWSTAATANNMKTR